MSRRMLARALLVLIAGLALWSVQSTGPAQACTPSFQDPSDPGSDVTGCPQTQAKWAAGAAATVAGLVALTPFVLGFVRLAGVRSGGGSASPRLRDPGFLSLPEGFRMPPPGGQAFEPALADQVEPWGLNDARTHGLLRRGTGSVVPLRSGLGAPGRAIPGLPFSLRSHVEYQAASVLVPGESATLYVNRLPCGARSGAGPGCEQNLPNYLPAGARLTVYGPDGYSRLAVGGGQ
ncbi:MAG TPA: DddA-like double-stranded DNA deaminase toxin [Mycobacteriales bacterium]|nr:DddA-like double-stranded DNA deaminase toxin [Mycobacteriales bacterium]